MKEELYRMLTDKYNNGSGRVSKIPETGDIEEITVDLTGLKTENPIYNPIMRDFFSKAGPYSIENVASRIFSDSKIEFRPNVIKIGDSCFEGQYGEGNHIIVFHNNDKSKKSNYRGTEIIVNGLFPEINVVSFKLGNSVDRKLNEKYLKMLDCFVRVVDCIENEVDYQDIVEWMHCSIE